MAQVSLKNIKKVYPVSKDKKHKKREDGPNLQITEEGVVAVQQFSLDIADREFVVLVGPSGCGKSTTLRMIAGLEEITDGELYIGDKLMNDVAPKDRNIAMVFQNYALYPHMTVYENMAFSLKLKKCSKEEIDKRVREAAHILNITEYLDRKPKALSGGQRQRVAIARALTMEPELLVADEPIASLDASIQAQIVNLFRHLQKEHGFSILFIAHDLDMVEFLCDRVGVMYHGKLVETGPAGAVFQNPLHPYTKALIAAIPIPDPQLEKNKVLYTYDPSIHDYSVDKPEFVDIGHNHFVYGNKKEIEEYKALREKGEPLQPITIRKPGEKVKEEDHEVHFSKAEDEFLKTPLHDTGSIWYKVLSFFFPIIGIIAAMVYKKKQYYHNYKACKQGALYGFAVLAVILLIFIIALILVVL